MGNLSQKNQLTNNDQWTVTNIPNYSNKNNPIIIVFSSFAASKGVYFYEIEIIQGTDVQFGWTNRLVEISEYNECFKNNKHSAIFKTKNLSINDIFGCFINIEKNIINFYYNGKLTKVTYTKNIFNCKPIFAVASVAYKHAIQINFGQKKFKYPPDNEIYETFHSVTTKRFPLFQIKTKNNMEWICKNSFENQFKLNVFNFDQNNFKKPMYFCDSEQLLFDRTITKIETMVNDGYDYEVIIDYVMLFLNSNFENILFRFLQSVVEKIGYKIKSDKINVLENCLILIYKECTKRFLNSSKINVSSKHLFFAPYIFNFLKSNSYFVKNQTKTRYICLILIHKNNNKKICCEYFEKHCDNFFYYVLQHSTDPWCQLYSIMGLINNNETKNQTKLKQYFLKTTFKKSEPPFLIWKNNFDKQNALKNTIIKKNFVQLQIYQYLHYYLPKISKTDKNEIKIKDFNLEICDTNCFIFSFSNLMVRSFKNGTIRYNFSINSSFFYFEVTIITVGSMRIGLATNYMNIKSIVGNNAFSIGIDGYNRCVWMHKKAYKFKTSLPSWNAGDVIGICVDFKNLSVIFGINNYIIEIDGDPFEEEFIFSKLPCHVASSFCQYQQCFFNFECKVIPQAFLNKSKTFKQNIHYTQNSFINLNSLTNYKNVVINGKCNVIYF